MNDVLIALIGGVFGVVPVILGYRRELLKQKNRSKSELLEKEIELQKYKDERKQNEIKSNVIDKFLDFASFNAIKTAAEEIFKETKADRFLLLFAINGKTHFNHVSVFFEQHKKSAYSVSAIARYKSLTIDSEYGKMLKRAESEGIVHVKTEDMPEDSLLKLIYEDEGVYYSDVRHLIRVSADEENDVLVYSSLATHSNKPFTKKERMKSNIVYDSIIKDNLIEVLKKNNYI